MVDLKNLDLLYFQSNKPVEYLLKNSIDDNENVIEKEYEIKIKPIKVSDWYLFSNCLDLFVHELQDYGDLNILRMSYLEFIYKILFSSKNKDVNMYKFSKIFELSIGINNFQMCAYEGKEGLIIKEGDKKVALITNKEFDDIKRIILYQNIYNYDDEYVSPDIKREVNKYNQVKKNDIVMPTFEDKKILVMIKTGIEESSINNMYYRTFSKMFDMLVDNDIYFVNKMMEASPKFDIKTNSTYPIYAKKENALSKAFVASEKLKSKIK